MVEFQQVGTDDRIRVLEYKYNIMRDRLFLVNQNMIQEYRKLIGEVKTVDSEIKDLKRSMFEIKNVLEHIMKEMQLFAKKENVQVLEKTMNFWNPLNFVTEEEVIKLIKEKGGRHGRSSKRISKRTRKRKK